MEELDTPTQKRVGVHIDRVMDRIGVAIEAGDPIPLSELKEVFVVCAQIGALHPEQNLENVDYAFEVFEEIASASERFEQRIESAMLCLATALLDSALGVSCNAIARELSSMRGIKAHNEARAHAADRARAVAAELWEKDADQLIRIGRMAQEVYAVLHEEGLERFLPQDADGVRAWIKPVAPQYAQRGGRSKKHT